VLEHGPGALSISFWLGQAGASSHQSPDEFNAEAREPHSEDVGGVAHNSVERPLLVSPRAREPAR